MQVIKVNTYSFKELSKEAKKKVLERLSQINVDYDQWHDGIIEDAKECGKILGIDIDKIYFSGFSSQGDGACFEGNYSYRKNAVNDIKAYAPKDEVLHSIAERLNTEQKKQFYGITANVKHSGHYYHQYCTDISVTDKNDNEPNNEKEICEILRDFMAWIYKQLEKEFDYQTEEVHVIETIEANDYRFLEDGRTFKA